MKKQKKRTRWAVVRNIIMISIFILGLIYIVIGTRYQNTFLPKTIIHGIDVSDKNIEQTMQLINEQLNQYTLTLQERDDQTEQIHGYDINLRISDGELLGSILKEQKPLTWGYYFFNQTDYEIDSVLTFDEDLLHSMINGLSCLNPELISPPVDAVLVYIEGSGYQIIPETDGNEPVPERLYAAAADAVLNLAGEISLDELGVYLEPQIREDDPNLTNRKMALEAYTNVTITYHFDNQTEILDGNTTHQWLSYEEPENVTVDREKAAEFVKELGKKYNTAYQTKQFKTSYGPTISISRGDYGWRINQQAETDALIEVLKSGQSQDREPLYLQRAAQHSTPDYGNTYVEINLTAQHLFYYVNGKLLIESDFVSGDEAKGNATRVGAYGLTYKERNATLRGTNYETPVTYWMPFDGNIGMHDGYWRSSFGGTIYKNNGSNGCINLPPEVAKTIFENIETNVPVLCYHLEGTERE